MPPFMGRRIAGRKISRAIAAGFRRRRMALAGRKRRFVYRTAMTKQNEPTFVETFKPSALTPSSFVVPSNGTSGQVFKTAIHEIPQVAQYANLYKQYRINWVKVYLLPEYDQADKNTAIQNDTIAPPIPEIGNMRCVYSIQDSPNVVIPATELEVLQDNGAKIKNMGKKLTFSFKPVPDVQTITGAGGNTIWSRQKYRQWFNFDLVTTGNNPTHGAVSAFFTLPGTAGSNVRVNVYYKVSISLRDPQ